MAAVNANLNVVGGKTWSTKHADGGWRRLHLLWLYAGGANVLTNAATGTLNLAARTDAAEPQRWHNTVNNAGILNKQPPVRITSIAVSLLTTPAR